MSQTTPTPVDNSASEAHAWNPAVQRCCEARERAKEEALAQGRDKRAAHDLGEKAYRSAMPHLSGYQNIRDFIACISYGTITGDIHPIEAPGFLYSAQVAISALRLEPKEPKQSKDKSSRAA